MKHTPMTFEEVVAFRDAAIADGWDHKPTYNSEGEDRAMTLDRDGFTMHVITRDGCWTSLKTGWGIDPNKREHLIAIWGPDKLSIDYPKVYSMHALIDGLRVCGECGAQDVDTHRVAFANRVCDACLPATRKRLETPGWYN